MARTTADAVAAIIEWESGIPLAPFIEAASNLVTVACIGDTDYGTDTVQLELIERWLAAHIYAIRDPRPASEKIDELATRFQSKVDLGLNVTHYGQMAMRLDYNGNLAALDSRIKSGKKKNINITWLGKTAEELETDL